MHCFSANPARQKQRLNRQRGLNAAVVLFAKCQQLRRFNQRIVLARFMPFIRTFVPFVAGVAAMTPLRFVAYNVSGAIIWVCGLTTAGYLFGETAFVQAHLSQIIWAMIFVPGLIALFGIWRARKT